jgi:hypothetical protein
MMSQQLFLGWAIGADLLAICIFAAKGVQKALPGAK